MKQLTATRLLNRASAGEVDAAADLLPLVYDELRALAEHFFRNERDNHTLQPTALVHEAYMRLVDQSSIEWKSQAQFFVIASKAMRNILVDHARARGRQKRGGGWQELTLHAVERDLGAGERGDEIVDMIALDDALKRLATVDERKARLVELRFFAGLSSEDAAKLLDISRTTAAEDWRMARAWLHKELRDTRPGEEVE
ncbi:MAG: sigma-70 family RNA polymerase sigma factor [Phycisphaerales bacterium JB043]